MFGRQVKPYETFPDDPIGSWKSAWQQAKKTAKVDCRWHDLRHSAISRIAAGGATDGTIQAIAGWMSSKMIERYSHIWNEAKRRAVAVLDKLQNRPGPPNFHPGLITRKEAAQEIEKAERLSDGPITFSDEYRILKQALLQIFANLAEDTTIG